MHFPKPDIIIVRYGEIGLKHGNREFFEQKLLNNIKTKLKNDSVKIHKENGQITIDLKNIENLEKIISKLKTVFGIVWIAPGYSLTYDGSTLLDFVKMLSSKKVSSADTFAVRAKRRSKNFPITSMEIEKKLGSIISEQTKAKVDLTNPQTTFNILIDHKRIIVYTDKIIASGGLPVGSSGKVLSLLSGGFDSIASSYHLAKRGAQVDFLHFHIFSSHDHVLTTKINSIVQKLSQFTQSQNLYLSSYLPFQLKTISLPEKYTRYELVVFRRLMHKIGEKIASLYGYQALVTGDSLGQVASQTMENLVAVDESVHIPIFRPLIGADKVDIIDLVKSIDLEKEAVIPYKDCCSIVSTHPAIRADIKLVKELEEYLKIDQIVEEIVAGLERIQLRQAN